jgi:DNA replication licensing factor MCM5
MKKGFSGVNIPRACQNTFEISAEGNNNCGLDPYIIDNNKCKFVDQQVLKLQETPDMVPVGEMPRHILLTVDRYLTNKVFPGSRVSVVGVYDTFQKQRKVSESAASIRNAYIRVVGLDMEVDSTSRGTRLFSAEEEAEYIQLSRNPDIYKIFAKSIAPSIYGNEDVKKSIACLLMGGSKKILPDTMRLRGDISVLLLGDPGTAKSQFLKFVERVAPISVYTSGKGSSAAGLTASVIKDPTTVLLCLIKERVYFGRRCHGFSRWRCSLYRRV